MPAPIMLIDVNGVGFAAQAAQMKGRLYAGPVETTAVYGVLKRIVGFREQFNGQPIVLWDGRSWRYERYPDYKGKRDSDPRLVEISEAWKAQRSRVGRMLKPMGVHQAIAVNMEADDLAAKLRRHYRDRGHEVVLVTGDKDWLQLIEEGVTTWDPVRERLVTPATFSSMTDLPTPYSVAEFKALQGDVSDNIKGVGGIGPKTASPLLHTYGTVAGFINAMMADPEARKTANPRALRLMDSNRQDAFRFNMELIHLDHPRVPKPEGMKIIKGAFDEEALRGFCEEHAFHSVLREFDTYASTLSRKDT